jgi:hypothetical protein
MRKKSKQLQSINPVLDAMFRDLGISERIKLDTLSRRWSDIFSGSLAEHTAPADLKEGMLVIAVDSPVWLQHLKFMKKDILEKLKGHGVRDIRFKHGSIYRDRENAKSVRKAEEPVYRKLTSGEAESIENAVTQIEDAELKTVIRSIFEKSVCRKRT